MIKAILKNSIFLRKKKNIPFYQTSFQSKIVLKKKEKKRKGFIFRRRQLKSRISFIVNDK